MPPSLSGNEQEFWESKPLNLGTDKYSLEYVLQKSFYVSNLISSIVLSIYLDLPVSKSTTLGMIIIIWPLKTISEHPR